MRENLLYPSPVENLACSNVQLPFYQASNAQKSIFTGVSSNVYYGYQPLTSVKTFEEPICPKELNKPCEMDTTPSEYNFVNRKRTREFNMETHFGSCKKRRQNEYENWPKKKPSPSKTLTLDEDLLRETHGCSYYHWVSSQT